MKRFSYKHYTFLALLVWAVVFIVVGCNSSTTTSTQTPQFAHTDNEWISMYPDEYNSYNVDKIDSDGKNGGHNHMRTLLETYQKPMPKLDASCIFCKTTASNALYGEYGEEALTMPWDAVKDKVEAYYDCAMCHTDSKSLTIKPSLVYYNNLARDTFAKEDIKTQSCGQCHNGLALYRSKIGAPDVTWDTYAPYRYGTDGDALYRSALEDGAGASPDAATGAIIVRGTSENDMEVFVNSKHDSLGVTCVDCHMPTTTKADGSTYTNHNASGSPLENPEALEYCLSCHSAQGIKSQEAMVKMVKDKQADTAALITTVNGKLDTVKQLLTEATAAGTMDAQVLDKARSNYAQANFFVQFYGLMLPDGTKVVHNPDAVTDYLNRSSKLLDEAISLLAL